MASTSSNSSSSGIGFFGALTLLFIALKLTGYIDWSWWWVLAPLWGGFAFVIFILACIVSGAILIEWRSDRRRQLAEKEAKLRRFPQNGA